MSCNKNQFKVGICGHYGGNQVFLDGQTVKTKIITQELVRIFKDNQVKTVDTYGGVKSLFRCLTSLLNMLKKCENVIILPAQNSVFIFPVFLLFFNRLYRKRLHYIVIGGWLPKLLDKHIFLQKELRKLDYIYTETSTMKKALERKGFANVVILPNCKKLNTLSQNELVFMDEKPLKLCTFSRVMKEKGIEDAVKVVNMINQKRTLPLYLLDIYGPIDLKQTEWFNKLKDTFSEHIQYKGSISYDESVETLREYFAILFPTHYFTEGIPGTIIDGYAAGVPVISAKWESFNDVVEEGETGYGYSMGNLDELEKMLIEIAENPDRVNHLKSNCLKKAEEFTSSNVIQNLIVRLR